MKIDTDIMTVPEVASYLRVNENTVYELFDTGGLPATRIGPRLWRTRKCWVDDWMARRAWCSTALVERAKKEGAETQVSAPNICPTCGGEAEAGSSSAMRQVQVGPRATYYVLAQYHCPACGETHKALAEYSGVTSRNPLLE